MPVQNNTFNNVSATGQVIVNIKQISQNQADNTSQVQVTGSIKNTGNQQESHPAFSIPCSITGTASFTGDAFGFVLDPGEELIFIQHTFVVGHGINGLEFVDFTVHYGSTGSSAAFPDNQATECTLNLTRIPKPSTAPGQLSFSNELPTSLTVSWTAPSDNGGSPVNDYSLRMYNGSDTSGSFTDNHGNGTSRNLKDLTPGATYTFTVVAFNNSATGISPASASRTVTLDPGCKIRVGGQWVIAVSYVRNGGVWKKCVPNVRVNGQWKQTK